MTTDSTGAMARANSEGATLARIEDKFAAAGSNLSLTRWGSQARIQIDYHTLERLADAAQRGAKR